MDQLGFKSKNLAKILGFRNPVTEALIKKRKLSLYLIPRLNRDLHMPTAVGARKLKMHWS